MTEPAFRILCIDDEEAIRQDVADELRDAGYEVVEAGDGSEGLEVIVDRRPDLVVSDLTMPRMDGHELLRRLRNDHPDFLTLPFIFLTAMSDKAHILEGKKLGADDYLTKPIDFDLLLVTIEARLNQVQRMNAQRDEQLVKLYQNLNTPPVGTQSSAGKHAVEGPPSTAEPAMPAPEAAEGNAGTGKHRPSEKPATPPSPPADLKGRLEESGGTCVAGKLQVVGLEAVKAAHGDAWPQHSKTVKSIAEATIRGHLTKDDVLEASQDHRFLIFFGSLSEQEAALKAQSIAEEIQVKLLGTDSLELVFEEEDCSVEADAHEVAIDPKDLAETDSIFDLVMAKVDQAAENARQRERAGMLRLVENAHIVPLAVTTRERAAAPIEIAEFDKASRQDVDGLRRARPGSDDLAADLDALRLGQTSEMLCKNAGRGQTLLLVNVSFSTLRSQKALERYLDLCAALTDEAKARLAINLGGIPDGYPFAKTQTLFHALRKHCRLVTLEFSDFSPGNLDLKALQASIVTCDHQQIRSKVAKQSNGFKSFISSLQAQKTRLLMYNVPNQKEADILFKLGVAFIAVGR